MPWGVFAGQLIRSPLVRFAVLGAFGERVVVGNGHVKPAAITASRNRSRCRPTKTRLQHPGSASLPLQIGAPSRQQGRQAAGRALLHAVDLRTATVPVMPRPGKIERPGLLGQAVPTHAGWIGRRGLFNRNRGGHRLDPFGALAWALALAAAALAWAWALALASAAFHLATSFSTPA